MIAVWILVCLAGLALTLAASRGAVQQLIGLVRGSRTPPFLVGLTLVALGTDLPEIVNSIVAAATDHGDINVGDSIGSATTQVTLVLGLLPFLGAGFAVQRRLLGLVGGWTVLCLGLGLWWVADGRLDRLDAVGLSGAWLAGAAVCWWLRLPMDLPEPGPASAQRRLSTALRALGFLALVGAGAWLTVTSLVEIARVLAAPEYVVSFFGLALGTSLPELAVDVTAIRRGQPDLAVGDVFGSSMVDASLSIAAGPLLFPHGCDPVLATRGGWIAVVAVLVAVGLLSIGARHTRWRGVVLLLTYLAIYPFLVRP